ncbi:MAG: hypothetical protein AB1782_08390 [Cyanobacteriota bacterium]
MKSLNQNLGGTDILGLYNKLGLKPDQKIVAVWGYPDPCKLSEILKQFPGHLLVDLDICYDAPESKVLPENYCQIITNIIDNALVLRDKIDIIVASVGEEKCDQGRFAAYLLEHMGLNVVKTKITKLIVPPVKPLIATSQLPLKEKVLLIMDSMLNPDLLQHKSITTCSPTHGFWGVPPNDLSLLDLFPDTTHVYGWTRCVEMKCPTDIELEMFVDKSIPTVFFAQTFCAKMQLAKYLAQKHEGLYVDIDDYMSVSVRAKIEAFLRLS